MYYDIVKAEYVKEYKIKITFADGSTGVADLKDIIFKNEIFSDLQDIQKFKKFKIHEELKVITWLEDIDIAPETLYALAVGEKISA